MISEYSNNGIIPEIPGELLVKNFVHKLGEDVLWVDQNTTERLRRDNQIPDIYSDGFAMIMPREKRVDPKQCPPINQKNITQIDLICRLYWGNYLCIFYHSNSKEEHHSQYI